LGAGAPAAGPSVCTGPNRRTLAGCCVSADRLTVPAKRDKGKQHRRVSSSKRVDHLCWIVGGRPYKLSFPWSIFAPGLQLSQSPD
jgi:hypothetical protein